MEIEPFRSHAERMLYKDCVREIDFAGSTYQLEIYDFDCKKNFWPFLQFDTQENIQDAFCSCVSEDERGCVHLAAAYLKIYNGKQKPLHVRFEHSFWNVLCALSADHSGYEGRFLTKLGEGKYIFENGMSFSIEARNTSAGKKLEQWIEKRPRETPENSIAFSNLEQEEITWWREGRPSPALRYALCFWSDLAKWALIHQEEAVVVFKDDEEGFPIHISVEFAFFSMRWRLMLPDLEKLIPTLSTINTSLQLLQMTEERVRTITYDEKCQQFRIEHEKKRVEDVQEMGKQIGQWTYISGKGFVSKEGSSFLSRSFIEKQEISSFLTEHASQVKTYIAIEETPRKLAYTMYFDTDWNWHFSAYLLEQGDLQHLDAALFKGWAYLPNKGFFRITESVFKAKEAILLPDKVSYFVNHNRIWLNGQAGFQTHLASIESHLSYVVTEDGQLHFHLKTYGESVDSHDFGDWIYYSGQGFFSKKHARLGLAVRPGIEVHAHGVSRFIKNNREELENIPHFFTQNLHVQEYGLEVRMQSATSIHVKPVYKGDATIRFYGDFVFQEGEGFCELPIHMRLPEEFQEEVTIHQERLASFINEELPRLKKNILYLDPELKAPLKCDLEVRYLVRTSAGGLKAELVFRTEHGTLSIAEIAEGYEKKRRYLFSTAGLFDLHDYSYQWIRHLTHAVHPQLRTVQLTTLEFIRLDATFSLLGPSADADMPTAEITRNLLRELREFTSHEPANTRGLKSELRLYQQTGLQWLWFLYKQGLSALLCDDMGLGKTHQAMALIASTLNQKDGEKKYFLVVCPTSVIYHWQDKLATFLPKVAVHTFHGVKRSLKNMPKEGLILTTYGILRVEKKMIEKIPFEVAIFDEIQVAKNPTSRVHEALTHVQARMRIGLTGTPIENNLRELKALFDIVLPGYMPGETRYREMFVHPIERGFDEEKKQLLSRMIRPFVLRRRKTEVLQELPEKSEDKAYCELSDDQMKLYKETLSAHRDELIVQLRDREAVVNYIHVFSLLSRLKQICNHPALVEKDPRNYKKYASGKWDLFVELLDEAHESEQKVVVFSQYLYMLDIMEQYLQERGWKYAQIRGDTVNRREELKRFQEDPHCVVFIGSLQAAGLGIDLTAASVVVMYDRWWNAARENQAIDRVHRIGQKRGVQVYKLITKGTIEEKIDVMITKKGQLLEDIIAADDQTILRKFTRSELIELLNFTEG